MLCRNERTDQLYESCNYHHILGYPGHMDDSNWKLIYHNGVDINLSNNTFSSIERPTFTQEIFLKPTPFPLTPKCQVLWGFSQRYCSRIFCWRNKGIAVSLDLLLIPYVSHLNRARVVCLTLYSSINNNAYSSLFECLA